MTASTPDAASPRIVVNAQHCDSETVAAIVVALTANTPSPTGPPAVDAWQLAALHEARLDQRIFRPQQLAIRGNQQW
jgi:hypothetical protein